MTLRVVKAGGSAGVDRDAVADLVASLAKDGAVVLVHGASAETDRLSAALGHPPETITSPSGHVSRRTDRRTLELFAMAALGVENFLYVEKLQARGVDAIGLSGLSGRLLVGRRKDVRALVGGKTLILRDDHTGTVDEVNATLLRQQLDARRVPVVAPVALSTEGAALNVDGDRVAARVAAALGAAELVILTNVPGLLRDVSDRASVVARATVAEAEQLAAGRMKKKVLAAKEALSAGVASVRIRGVVAGAGTEVVA
ncbi:MAG TPA: [LysW]-aminoadipate kinase [Candidatus Limnocylindria bacterium]|nr:[LysW]-aminoadipate kinase [Candidatus Limnocylindria bacterium]